MPQFFVSPSDIIKPGKNVKTRERPISLVDTADEKCSYSATTNYTAVALLENDELKKLNILSK